MKIKMLDKPIAWLVDTITGMTLIAGIINSDAILKFVGIMAAFVTTLNHGYAFYKNFKNKNNAK